MEEVSGSENVILNINTRSSITLIYKKKIFDVQKKINWQKHIKPKMHKQHLPLPPGPVPATLSTYPLMTPYPNFIPFFPSIQPQWPYSYPYIQHNLYTYSHTSNETITDSSSRTSNRYRDTTINVLAEAGFYGPYLSNRKRLIDPFSTYTLHHSSRGIVITK